MGTKRWILLACCSGIGAFSKAPRSPTFDLFQARDIVWLMLSGASFGLAVVALGRLLMKKIDAWADGVGEPRS
jgi:hypothetical protein